MSRALGDHMSQRRLKIFYLVDHHSLYFAYGVIFDIAERRVQETVGKAEAQPFKDRVRHAVRGTGRQSEGQYLQRICRERQQAPLNYRPRRCSPRDKQAYHPVHTVEWHKSESHRQHRQDDRQHELFLFSLGVGEKSAHPAFLFSFHKDSSFPRYFTVKQLAFANRGIIISLGSPFVYTDNKKIIPFRALFFCRYSRKIV